jgi:PKD domain
VADGQVVVPPTAAERKGIQPVITVKANGQMRADVAVGQPVTLTAMVEMPPQAGHIVAAEWDFDGSGSYSVKVDLQRTQTPGLSTELVHSFDKSGTYFVTLRAASQRDGDGYTRFARVQNLGRARIVVR